MKGITARALYQDLFEDLLPFCTLEGAPEQSPRSFIACQLKDNLFKKLTENVAEDADDKALEKFLQVNETCRNWRLDLTNLQDELLLGELKSTLHQFFEGNSTTPLLTSTYRLFLHGTVGPGQSIGCVSEDFYTKLFDSQLSHDKAGLYRLYADHISSNPSWSEAEKIRLVHRGPASVVRGNRLAFVPKDDEISRTICIEPVLNMFYQQGAAFEITERLKSFFGIDLSTQPDKNRLLAKIGSERAACSRGLAGQDLTDLVTTDLKSASDSQARNMLKEVLPPVIYGMLELFACSECELPDGSWIKLHMISTMGNAFTFPLQTALFAAIVLSAAKVSGISGNFHGTFLEGPYGQRLGNFGVFGDDIICPRVIADKVHRLLKLLGFTINGKKTFGANNTVSLFRESCGADFIAGLNCRPVFCKSLTTPQDVYSLINRLNAWSYTHKIPLRRVMRRLLKAVPHIEVPQWESDDCGIKVPLLRHCQSKTRYRQGSILYKRFVPRKYRATIDIEVERIFVPRGRKPLYFNREGLYLAFLRGSIVNGSITLRPRVTVYTTKVGIAPNWEFSPTAPSTFYSVGGPDLESLACATFVA